jgi:hypothetical protein
MNKKYILHLTVSVNPESNFPSLKRSNFDDRLSDYITSIKFWVSKDNIEHIYITEDTNTDLKSFLNFEKSIMSRLTFINLTRDNQVFTRGKGYGEYLQISEFVSNLKVEHTIFPIIKCTGRDIVLNYEKIFNHNDKFDICADIGEYLTYSESRIFCCSYNFLSNYFLKIGLIIDERELIYFEHALARSISRAISDNFIWRPLKCFPRHVAYSGTKNKKIAQYSLKKILKYFLKNILYKK